MKAGSELPELIQHARIGRRRQYPGCQNMPLASSLAHRHGSSIVSRAATVPDGRRERKQSITTT